MTILTDKTELTAPATGDFLHIVDVSDTTDNAAGTSKKITTANLAKSSPVGDGTAGPWLDGSVDGGTEIRLSGPSGGAGFYTAIQAGNPLANRLLRLPIGAPPATGAYSLINLDEYGNMGQQSTSANIISLLGAADYAAVKGLLDTDDIQTLTGIAAGTAHLGTFTGTTITDSSTIKTALQELETAVESAGGGAVAPSTLNLTTDTSISEAQIIANRFISNEGATGEVDVTLPVMTCDTISVTFIIKAAYVMEIGPPSGGQLDHQGTLLTADYVVDSPAILRSKAVLTWVKIGALGVWSIDVARGTWVNPGRVSD